MVRFSSNPENFDTMGVLRRIEANVDECIALDTKIAGLDEKITLNPSYIKKANSTAAAAAAAAGASHRYVIQLEFFWNKLHRKSKKVGKSRQSRKCKLNHFGAGVL